MTEPAAGWYHDPADAGAWRWWDGSTWTDHVRPMDEPQVVTGPVQYEPVPTHAPVFEEPIVAPQPVTAPTQVGPTTIPQPGQVASAPTAVPPAGGAVRMTPETPVGDQLYWHSSAAEVIEVPRLSHPVTSSHAGPGGAARTPSYVRDWNDLGSPHTPGIWLLAFWPLIGSAVAVGLYIAMNYAGVLGTVPALVGGGAALLLAWTFAAMDARALGERGYHPPRLAWMLLFPPLAYLISRGKAVRRESKSAWQPELLFIVTLLGVVAMVAAAVLLFAAVIFSMLPVGTTF